MTPIMIVTRPDPQGADFAAAIQAAWDGPIRIIRSPLLQIAPLAVADDLSGISAAIFTSVNGVAQAKALGLPPGIVAYCVGEQTANAAASVGFAPVTGPGDAAQLIALILAQRPAGVLAHIRGLHARGNIADALTDAGLPCRDVIAYDQHAKPLTDIAHNALQGQNPVVVPLFSARTCTIFQRSGSVSAPLHVVAISPAALPTDLHAVTTTVASAPDGPAMIRATLDCLRAIKEGDHGIPLA
ncbi:uroporphyrinogen-III synthase [Yoonia sp.]|uniref:uroporphyrinogen-III synthase n=1 Tax=Yoonia sp. TaxID=2212373 RepID=UPI003F6BBEC1